VHADPTRLRQILMNLSANAVKFTPHGKVQLDVRMVEGASGSSSRLRFDITDTGIGMTEQEIQSLFQPFIQADSSTTRRFGGTGLGLTISRRFARMLGGDITVRSTPNKGTTFTVEIEAGPLDHVRMIDPAREADAGVHKAKPTHQPVQSLDGLHVLLAEDGPDNQRLISFVLRKAGASVHCVEDGQRACAAALAESYDVVLMDMQMPGMDGYDAARELRHRGYTKPIIALTAHAMAGDRERCITAGCDDYATKPIDRQGLIDAIAHWAAASRQRAA
jgi:CheY-like chemotaxis protein